MYGKPVKGHVTVTYGLLWHGHVFTVGKQRNLQVNRKFLLLFFFCYIFSLNICFCGRASLLLKKSLNDYNFYFDDLRTIWIFLDKLRHEKRSKLARNALNVVLYLWLMYCFFFFFLLFIVIQ